MKIKFSIALIFLVHIVFSQEDGNKKIDSKNYYSYYLAKDTPLLKGQNLTTHWLSIEEVVPIITEELKLAKFEFVYEHSLYKLSNNQNIVLSVYCRQFNFGYLFIEGHSVFPKKEQRLINNRYRTLLNIDYSQCEETFSGHPNFIKIKKLPSNIFILSEDCYWYQTTNNKEDNNVLVTREIAINILREDIRNSFTRVSK